MQYHALSKESTAAAEIAGIGNVVCDYNDRRCLSSIIDGWRINQKEYYQLEQSEKFINLTIKSILL